MGVIAWPMQRVFKSEFSSELEQSYEVKFAYSQLAIFTFPSSTRSGNFSADEFST